LKEFAIEAKKELFYRRSRWPAAEECRRMMPEISPYEAVIPPPTFREVLYFYRADVQLSLGHHRRALLTPGYFIERYFAE